MITHFPKHPDSGVCKRTNTTRAKCRRLTRDHIFRAGKFGDLITADHMFINEEGESRNNRRYAVILQDLAHSVDAKLSAQNKKTSQDTTRSLPVRT